MGREAIPAKRFALAVRDVISAEMVRQEKTHAEMWHDTSLGKNYSHKRLQGTLPFNLDDLKVIADWLNLTPLTLIQRAQKIPGASLTTTSRTVKLAAPTSKAKSPRSPR